jgi:ATP-binding cassette, subfamily B, bacterial MsbA
MARDMNSAAAPPQESVNKLMIRLVKLYLRPYAGQVALSVFFMILASAMTAALAKLMQPILDDVLGGQRDMIVPIAVAVLVVFCIRGISTFMHTIIMNKVSQSIVGDIQKHLFSHFMLLDLSFFHANPSGQLMSRVVNDVQIVRLALSETLTNAGKSFVTFIFLTVIMFMQDPVLAIAAFIILPFSAGFISYIGRRLRKISKSTQAETGVLSDLLSQTFSGIRQVKAYGMEGHEQARADIAIDKVRKLNIKAVRIGNMLTPVNELLVGLVIAGIVLYGGHQVANGDMTAGQLGSFLAAFTMAYEPVKRMARTNNLVQTGLGAAERIFHMLDLKPSIEERADAITLSGKKPTVVFENAGFHYENTEVQALRGITFTAYPGKVTALVGPSGAGKSTIINLVPRFYDVQSGSVKIDGHDVRDLKLSSIRSNIALVSQDITIFDDTVYSNIAYGRPGASEEEIRAAAKSAAADTFINALPEGYQTRVGEDGVKLSGGQKQRIAIARAILRDAPILLLDEATSALDNESEKAVQSALKELEKGRTTIVIAHRLSTVQAADQIIVMDEGKVAEQGKHDELLARDGLYARMYRAGLKE